MTVSLSSLRVEASMDASAYVDGANAKAAADAKMIDSGNKLAGSLDQTDRRLSISGTGYERLARSLDPAYAAQAKLEVGTRTLQRALDNGSISTDQHALRLQQLTARYAPLIQGGAAAAGTIGVLATAARGTGQDLEKFAGAHDKVVGSTMAVREGIRLTHEMLTGEYSRAISTSIVSLEYLGIAHKLVAAAMNPFVIGAAAVAGGLFLVFQRAGQAETQLRSFNVILDAMGTNSSGGPAGLVAVVQHLRDTGSATADAVAAVQAINRVQGISPTGTAAIADVARDIAAVKGENFDKWAADLAKTLAGTSDEIIKMGFSLGGSDGLTVAEATQIKQLKELGQNNAAAQILVAALGREYSGRFKESLGEGKTAINEMFAAYNDMLDKLADTSAIKGAESAFTDLLKSMSALLSTPKEELPWWTSSATGLFNMGAGAMSGARDWLSQRNPGAPSVSVAGPIGDYGIHTELPGNLAAGGGMGVAITSASITPIVTSVLDSIRTGAVPGASLGGAAQAVGRAEVSGASGRLNTGGLDVNGATLQRLTTVLDAALSQTLPDNYSARLTSTTGGGHTPGSYHYKSQALDYQIYDAAGNPIRNRGADTSGLYTQTAVAGYRINQQQFPGTNFASGINFGVTPGSNVADLMHLDAGPQRGSIGTPLPQLVQDTGQTARAKELTTSLDDLAGANTRLEGAQKSQGLEGKVAISFWTEYNAKLKEGYTVEQAQTAGTIAATHVRNEANIELAKAAALAKTSAGLELETAKAYGVDEIAGLKATAMQEARIAAITTGVPVQQKYNELLLASATSAVLAGAKAEAAMVPQIAAQQRLADAAAKSTGALHDQEIANEAIARTQDAYNKALATGNAALIDAAKAEQDRAQAQASALDILKQKTILESANSQSQNQIQVAQLEVSLQGQTSEEIARQVALLQAKQDLEAAGLTPATAEYQTRLKIVDALGREKIALSDAQLAQSRIKDTIKSTADTINNTLTKSITDAFDGTKVTNWHQTIKSAIGQIASQITQMALLKPLEGSILSALGLGGAAQGFGSLGSLFGGSSSSTTATVSQNSNGTFSLSNISGGTSLLKDTLGSGSSGGIFSTGGLFGSQGSLFGTSADASIAAGGAPLSLGSSLASDASTGLLGGLGLGSILGIGGAVLGGVSLLGSLFGLFDSKPKNNFSRSFLNLASGDVTGFTSGGVGANDTAAKSVTSSLSSFIPDLLKQVQISSPGAAAAAGGLTIGAGSVKGIVADTVDAQGNVSSQTFADAASATSALELQIAQGLTGVSATMKTVLAQITDASKISAAITFAQAYDDLKTASDSAFSSISTDTSKLGPYATALKSLNTTFDDLTSSANSFGLSLDPITKGLAFAKTRLITDFGTDITNLTNAVINPVQAQIDAVNTAAKAQLADAKAIGADLTQVNTLTADSLTKIWKDATTTLQDLSDSLKSGALSGKSAVDQAKAANDNYLKELKLVQGGNLSEATNLATAGSTLISDYQSLYGNSPTTTKLRTSVLDAVDKVLASRSFAGGTDSTPAGWIRVGERGPEWMYQGGGASVLPTGTAPSVSTSSSSDLLTEMRAVRAEIAAARQENTRVTAGVGVDTGKRLDAGFGALNKQPLTQPPRRRVA